MKNRNQNITMQLNGRLGNQMFQYAFGRAAQEKAGGQLIINFLTYVIPGAILDTEHTRTGGIL